MSIVTDRASFAFKNHAACDSACQHRLFLNRQNPVSTFTGWMEEPVLDKIDELNTELPKAHPAVRWLASAELFSRRYLCAQHQDAVAEPFGMVIYDDLHQPMIHVVHTQVDFGSCGHDLTRHILQALTGTDALFRQIAETMYQRFFDTQEYRIVVSAVDQSHAWHAEILEPTSKDR